MRVLIFDLDNTLTAKCFEGRPEQKQLVINIMHFAYVNKWPIYIVTSRASNELAKKVRQNEDRSRYNTQEKEENYIFSSRLEDVDNNNSDIINAIVGIFGNYSFDGYRDYQEKLKRNSNRKQWMYYNTTEWINTSFRRVYDSKFEDENTDAIKKQLEFNTLDYSQIVKMSQIEHIKYKENVRWENIFFFDDSKDNLDTFRFWKENINQNMEYMHFIGGVGDCVFNKEPINNLCKMNLMDSRFCEQ